MRTKELNRVEFLSWLSGLDDLPTDDVKLPRPASQGGKISLIWIDSSASSQPLIGVPASELRDFLAFTSTYVGSYAPFTAFFRVIPLEMIDFLPEFHQSGREDSVVQDAMIGAIIADTAVHSSGSPVRVADLTVQSCLATAGASVARAVEIGYENSMAKVALERWHSVDAAFSASRITKDQGRLEAFWSTVLAVFSPESANPINLNDNGSMFLREVFTSRSRGHDVSDDALSMFLPDSVSTTRMLRSSREDRVRALEQIHSQISTYNLSSSEVEIILGFAAAQVAEGSLSYLPLIMKYDKDYPISTLWFGLFCGLKTRNDVLTAGNCLGRRVLRQIRVIPGLLPDISADVNYEECLLLTNELKRRKIRTDLSSIVEVEILPGVSAPFRLPRLPSGVMTSISRTAYPTDEQIEKARRLTAELASLLRTTQRYSGDEVASLFPDDDGDRPVSTKSAGGSRRKPRA